ncbi:unnamed protein product [Mytilus coruscus]|uniref:Uncharacterized protein n=1 Tax=Mytilus coruscus TaxID=42192 RepID=A0A6J8C171_MYTCO|nr:unnamed protein product [Mytilus coruscus]
MTSQLPKRSNRKRKRTQRLEELTENIDSSEKSQSNPNVPNTNNDEQVLRISTFATPIITPTVVNILKSTGVIQGKDAISPDLTLIPAHQSQSVNSICPPRQDNNTCNATDMTTQSQSHASNMIVNQLSESSNPSYSNVINRSCQQCSVPIEGTLNQHVVNHLLQNNSNTGTFSTDLGGLSRLLALGVDPKLKADIWSNKYTNLEDLLKSKSRVVKYVPVEKDDSVTFVKSCSNKAKIESMAQWHEAFRIYGAIYFENYPTESPKLLKYTATIANLAEKAGIESAFSYDQEYRQWREVNPLHLTWDGVNEELFNEALAMGLIGKTNASS